MEEAMYSILGFFKSVKGGEGEGRGKKKQKNLPKPKSSPTSPPHAR